MAAPWTEGDETSTVSLKILKGYKGYKSRERFWFKSIHSSFVWFVCIVISCGILELFIFIKKWMPIWRDLLEILELYTNLSLQQSFGIPVVKSLMCQGHKWRSPWWDLAIPWRGTTAFGWRTLQLPHVFFLWSTGNGIDMLWCFDLVCSIDTSAWLSFF